MSIPPEPKVIDKFTLPHLWHSLFVFITFLGIDFIYYGLIHSVTPYSQDLVAKIIWTAVLALAFTGIYNHAAIWRPNVVGNIVGKGGARVLNSVFFSLVIYVLILSAIALSGYVVSVVFIYVLNGFHSSLPASGTDDAVLAAKILAGGLVLELCGKDETKEGRTGG